MATIKVTSDELHAMSAQLKTAAEQIKATSEQARGQVQGLAGTWQGTANSAFEQAFASWKTGADQVDQALQRISELLNNAAQQYESTEGNITSSFH